MPRPPCARHDSACSASPALSCALSRAGSWPPKRGAARLTAARRVVGGGAVAAALVLGGCASTPSPPVEPVPPAASATAGSGARAPEIRPPAKSAARRGGAFYLDDGPGDNPPPNLAEIPDAVPRTEPLHRFANRPYVVFGRSYTPMTERKPYKARGVATWYGKRYHGQKTSSGEVYDMYAMTGAHPTLPIPSFVRVTHVGNGRSVVIRINDRGPFIGDRLIDLSYAAAFRLGYVEAGSANVDVEKLIPGVNWFGAENTADARRPTAPGTLAAPLPGAASTPPPATPATPGAASTSAAPTVIGVAPTAPIAGTPLPPAPAAAAGNPLPLSAEAGGTFLQLAAFSDRANADAFLAKIRPELGEFGASAHVFAGKGLFRVHIGPYGDERQARTAADRLVRELNIKPMVTVR
jgi:rare lipoprotein A